jgi:hypothetical protein
VTAGAARPYPGDLPSPGVARYGVLALLLAIAGVFAGLSTYNAVLGRSWMAAEQRCRTVGPVEILGDLAGHASYLRCMAGVEHQRALFALGGALAIVALGLMLMPLLAYRLLRRAGPLRPADTALTGRVAELARNFGIRRVPAVVVGDWRLREPFTIRTVGAVRIVVPPGFRRLPSEQRDAVIRHELAHVRGRDVTLVWLTRGLWWAGVPALAAPPILLFGPHIAAYPAVLVEAPLPLLKVIMGDPYWWNHVLRSVLLLGVAMTVARAVLRSREHEADLCAGRNGGRAGLLALLRDQVRPAPSRWRSAFHRLRAVHPSAERRLAALGDPDSTMALRARDTASAGLLIGMTVPVLYHTIPARVDYGLLWGNAAHLAGLLAGVLFALVAGTMIWRAVLIAERAGRTPRLRSATLALAAATGVGLVAQVSGTHLIGMGIFGDRFILTLLPLAVGGAAALSGVLAQAWTTIAGPVPRRGWWVAIAGLNAVLFTGALWTVSDLAMLMRAAQLTDPHRPYAWLHGLAQGFGFRGYAGGAAVTLAGIAVLVAWWTRRRLATRLPGTAALVVGSAAGALAVRWLVLPPAGAAQTMNRDYWVATAAGAAVLTVMLAWRGLAAALVAAPVATVLVSVAIWLRYVTEWDHVWGAARIIVTVPLSMLATLLVLVSLPILLVPGRGPATAGDGQGEPRSQVVPRN